MTTTTTTLPAGYASVVPPTSPGRLRARTLAIRTRPLTTDQLQAQFAYYAELAR